ncbi:MAG: hypothetical protein LBG67_02445 [Campylobacteraceae bacterium]|jgi:predicted RNA-binding Zn-ribbon protein involved in translation (DUF1610 family)|nr:hypothetical protein [Campylobacteraceae bacterium]
MEVIKSFYIKNFSFFETWMIWATVLVLFLVIVVILFIFKKEQEDFKRFTTFNRYGLIWKWKYDREQIASLWCYCPDCGSRLICDDEHSRSGVLGEKSAFFICNACGENEKGKVAGGDRNHVLRIVKHEIYKLIKSNQYKEELI